VRSRLQIVGLKPTEKKQLPQLIVKTQERLRWLVFLIIAAVLLAADCEVW